MHSKILIQLVRYVLGTIVLVVSAICHTDGVLVATGIVLLGLPVELVSKSKE